MSRNNDNDADESSGSLLRQTLMNVDECFLYKLPPLATSGGHRAEQWDLAKPLQTCGFQVERRNNDLYLLFTTDNHTKLFALSQIRSDENVQQSVQGVVDSSRYFVTQIQSSPHAKTNIKSDGAPASASASAAGRSVYVGFGFRDRDVAIDLLGNLQQFQKSIQRELQAKNLQLAEIPKLAEGEKIHINFGNKNSSKSSDKNKTKTTTNGGGGGPFLLKKPPKVESNATGTMNTTSEGESSTTTTTAPMTTATAIQVLPIDPSKIQDDHKSVASTDSDMAHANMTLASVTDDLGAAGLDDDDDDDDDDDNNNNDNVVHPLTATAAEVDDDDDDWDDFQQA